MPNVTTGPRPIGATALALFLTLLAVALALPSASVAAPEGGSESLTISPSSGAFPKTTVGTQSSTREFDVANEGEEEASVGYVAIEVGDTSDFNLNSSCGGTVYPGGHCSVWVTFAPGSVGEKQATLVIHFNDGRPDQPFALTGTSVPPQFELSPAGHDFGVQWVHSGTDTTFQLSNGGEAPAQVGNLEISEGSNAFSTGWSDCWGRWLQPGEACSVQVWFNPHDTVAYSGQLRAGTNGYSFTAELSGAGGRVIVEAFPNPVEFGSATVGAAGSTRTIVLTNSGDLPGAFFIAVVAGGDAGSFQLLDENCTDAPVMPSASCTAHVRFNPQSVGARSARLALFGEGEGGNMVMLRGEGVLPAASLAPSVLDFGQRAVGTRSSGHYFTVRNDGTTQLELGGATIVGSDLDQFILAGDTCSGAVLGAGEECLLAVRFGPDGIGFKAATLRVSAGARAFSASLTGLGVARRPAAKAQRSTGQSRRLRRRSRHSKAQGKASARCRLHRCRATLASRVTAQGG